MKGDFMRDPLRTGDRSLGSDDLQVLENVLEQESDLPVESRRMFLRKAALLGGGLGAAALVGPAAVRAGGGGGGCNVDVSGLPYGNSKVRNDPTTILKVATTAEVLATIVNTVGFEKVKLEPRAKQAIAAAAREEFVHYKVLLKLGGQAITRNIWIPDAVFSSREAFLNTVEVGDQIFINAYLLATLEFGYQGNGALAAVASEFMGVEGVHRAFARFFNGKLGNDRVFMKFDQRESAPDAPNEGQPGFENILGAVEQLQAAGFGFGAMGAKPGRFYRFGDVKKRVPDPAVNTLVPDWD